MKLTKNSNQQGANGFVFIMPLVDVACAQANFPDLLPWCMKLRTIVTIKLARYHFCGRKSHLKQIGGYTRHAFRQLSIEELVLNNTTEASENSVMTKFSNNHIADMWSTALGSSENPFPWLRFFAKHSL